MARVCKLTAIMNGPGRGWTEAYYQVRSDNNLVNAINQFKQVCDQRVKLLGNGYAIQGYRAAYITDDTGKRVRGGSYSKLETIESTATLQDGDFSDTSILVMFKNQDSTRTKFTYLRGVWDEVVVGEGAFLKDAGLVKDFNSFKGALVKGGYGWYGRVPNQTLIPVEGYTSTAGSIVTISFPAATWGNNELNVPQIVSFQGINTKSRLNGQQVVIPLTATTARLQKPLAVGVFVGGGFMRKLSYDFVAITEGIMQRIVSRKTGNPLFVSRGRQPVRART